MAFLTGVTMSEIFTNVSECFTALIGVITSVLSWAVSEPLILIGLTVSVAGAAIGLFSNAKGAVRA